MADEIYLEDPEDEVTPTFQYEIMNYPADTTLRGYVDMWDRSELVIPDFQRKFVWDQVRASKLIESFLLGLPIPGVFLFKRRDKSSYLIIDGQQRIRSIIAFMKGEFKDRKFQLKNVSDKWSGKRFTDLSEEEQFRLQGAVLRSTIIQQISPDDHTSIYLIFERLNSGGVNLSPMEIRQCVSNSPFMDHLKSLNDDENWRRIIGQDQPDIRLRDVELILRCLALHNRFEQYDKPMKGFLNEYAEREKINPSDYDESKRVFSEVCSAIIEQLGEKPFHFKGRLNYGLLDSVLSSLLKVGPKENLKVAFKGLIADKEFEQSITLNTSDVLPVKTRIGLALAAFSDN